MTNPPLFKDWFFDKFSKWEQTQPGRRSTYTDFAYYLSRNSYNLNIRQQYVSNWIQGIQPSDKYLPALAEMLGDEVYDILDSDPPNPYLNKITQIFGRLSTDDQRKLAEKAEEYVTQNEDAKRTSPKRKTLSNN